MNRLEFNEIIKAVNIDNALSTTTGIYGTTEDVHYWNNLAIWFGGSYYTIIHGIIPLEVANIIYRKYPDNPYNIRINGGSKDWVPNNYAIDKKYKKEIQEYNNQNLSSDEYLIKCQNAKKRLIKRNNINKYITAYHIDSKEGLLIFLTEMKDYYLRKDNKRETEVKKFDEIRTQVTKDILKKVDLSISAYEWMQEDKQNKVIYNSSIERDNKTKVGQFFRKAISNFDNAINPFLNKDLEFDDIDNYLKLVDISANTYNSADGKYRKNCCRLEISTPYTGNSTIYYRNPDGFSFQLMYKVDDNQYLNVSHYFSNSGSHESDKGEVIAVNYFKDNAENNIDIRLNITNGKVGLTNKCRTTPTSEQVAFIYNELIKATGYASSITIENMKKNENNKQLVLNKKNKS